MKRLMVVIMTTRKYVWGCKVSMSTEPEAKVLIGEFFLSRVELDLTFS